MIVVDTTPVVGLPQRQGWSQVFQSANRSVLVAFSVAGHGAHNVGRDIVELLKARTEQDNGQSTVLAPADFHQLLLKIKSDVAKKDCQISLSATLLVPEKHQVLVAAEHGQVWLKRGSKVGHLLQADSTLKLIQGSVEMDDVLVLATDQASSLLEEVELKFGQGYEVESIVTSLVPGLHGLEDSSRSAIAFAEITDRSRLTDQTQATAMAVGPDTKPDSAVQAAPKMQTSPQPAEEFSTGFNQDPVGLEVEDQPATQSVSQPEPSPLDNATPSPAASSRDFTGASTFINPTQPAVSPQPARSLDKPAWGDQLKAVFGQLKNILPQKFGSAVYVQSGSSRKLVRLVIIAVLVLLPVVGGVGWWWQQQAARERQSQELLAPLQARLTELRQLADSNVLAARAEADQLLNETAEQRSVFVDQQLNVKDIISFQNELEQFYDSISGQEQQSDLPVEADLRTIDTEFITVATDFDGSDGFFADAERGVIRLTLDTKQQSLFQLDQADPNPGTVKDIRLKNPTELVLLSSEGLFELNLASDPTSPTVTQLRSSEDQTQAATQVGTFGDFIYLVSNADQQIYRYVPADEGYANPVSWVQGALPANNVASMAIDGNVWLGTTDGQIIKMRSGSQESFEVTDLPTEFSSKLVLFANDTTDNLYVLEPDASRVVVLTKEGQFVQELTSPILASTTSLFVDEETDSLYAVSGAEIFLVELGAVGETEAAEPAEEPEDNSEIDSSSSAPAENTSETDSSDS